MDPLTVLATVDAAITVYARAMALLDKAREEGVITPEEQAARKSEVAMSRALAGLPPVADAFPPGEDPRGA